MVLTPIFAVCCAFYLIIYFHLKNLLFFSNAVAKPLLFYKRFFFFKSLSARTKLAILFCRSALFSSLGRTEGLFPRLKTPKTNLPIPPGMGRFVWLHCYCPESWVSISMMVSLQPLINCLKLSTLSGTVLVNNV